MLHIPRGLAFYDAALEGLARVDTLLYQERGLASIYAGGVRYRREQPKREEWRNADQVLREGFGDCEDLAAARVGELRAAGDVGAVAFAVQSGPRMVHIKVLRGDGGIEDPSRRLGMGKTGGIVMRGDDDYSEGDEEEIGADLSTSAELTWSVERMPNGWRGVVRVPLYDGKALYVKRGASNQATAAKKALDVATKVLDDPRVAAVIPAPARFALNLVRSPKARALAKNVLKLF